MAPATVGRKARGQAKQEERAAAAALAGGPTEDEPEVEEEPAVKPAPKRKRAIAPKGESDRQVSKRLADMNIDKPAPEPKTTTRTKATARGKKVQQTEDAEGDDMVLDENDEEEEVAQPAKKQKKTAAAKTPVVKTPAVKPPRPADRGRKSAKKVIDVAPEEIDDDADVMDVDEDQLMVDAPPPAWAVGLQTNMIGAFTTQNTTLQGEIHTVQETMTGQFQTIDNKVDTVSNQVQTLDDQLKDTKAAIDKHSDDIDALGTRFDSMDVKMDVKMEEQTTAITAQFDIKFEEQTATFGAAVGKVNNRVDDTDKKVNGLAKQVEELGAKFTEFLEQTDLRQQVNTRFEEKKDILSDLAATCLDTEKRTEKTEKRTKNELKTVIKKVDELKSMVRAIDERTRLFVQEADEEDGDEDHNDDHEDDRDMDSDHDDEGDEDDEGGDDSGNGGGGRDALENGTTSHEQEELGPEDSVAEQLRAELHTAHMARPDDSAQGRQYSPPRPNINLVVCDEDIADYGNTTLEPETPPGERRSQ